MQGVWSNAAAFLLWAALVACGQPSEPHVSHQPGENESAAAYIEEIEAWHAERDASLRKSDSWLTLVGLYWLRPGVNSAGSAPGSDLAFPEGAPPNVGTFTLEDGKVRFDAQPGMEVLQAGAPVRQATLDPLAAAPTLEIGSLSFHAIERAGRIGIRLRDSETPALAAFTGMEHFPIEPGWRITARFEPHAEPKHIKVPNIIGASFDEPVYGEIVFDVEGKIYRLDPLYKPEDGFFVVFGDATNGKETYHGGRFVGTDPPAKDGSVVLDFNKAYNPPCVFTPYATCPLPPSQNRLPFPIEAGEKMYRAGLGGGH